MAELHGAFPRDCCRCGSHDAHGESAEQGCLGKRRVAKGIMVFAIVVVIEKLEDFITGNITTADMQELADAAREGEGHSRAMSFDDSTCIL